MHLPPPTLCSQVPFQSSASIKCNCIGLQDQMQDVLDAMFERTVESGDYVIRQGDDGDNFYVIDR